jgi:hypothetical protein
MPRAALELWVLPLRRETLNASVFLQEQYWPAFGETGVAGPNVTALRWITTARTTLLVG